VVGINTAINPRANTIGFAVPIEMAKEILPSLKASGFVTRGWLGVVIQQITPDLKDALKLESAQGALISRVDPNGPAQKAGIQRGDVIVRFAGQRSPRWKSCPPRRATAPAPRPTSRWCAPARKELPDRGGQARRGPAVARAEEKAKRKARWCSACACRTSGPTGRAARRPAKRASSSPRSRTAVRPPKRLRRGDVILEVNQTAVANVAEFRNAMHTLEKALLLVRRGEATLFVAVKKTAEK
jgi:serine protease Do